jgi:hypothetical protein
MTPIDRRMKMKVEHARSFVGRGTRYRLGAGGMDPRVEPGQLESCDCSGFMAILMGISRKQADKGKPWSADIPWIETTAIVRDAVGAQQLCVRIRDSIPGCFVAYGDTDHHEGHCGVVTETIGRQATRGIDCASGIYRRTGDAIHEHPIPYLTEHPGRVFFVLREDTT